MTKKHTYIFLFLLILSCLDKNKPSKHAVTETDTENISDVMWNKFSNIITRSAIDKDGSKWILTLVVTADGWKRYNKRAKVKLVDGAFSSVIKKYCKYSKSRCIAKVITEEGTVVARGQGKTITILR